MDWVVELPGYERLSVKTNESGHIESFHLEVSLTTHKVFHQAMKKWGLHLESWQSPELGSLWNQKQNLDPLVWRPLIRSLILIKELILKVQGKWTPPHLDEVVCHCRNVNGDVLYTAIAAGAHTLNEISQWTSACTACTTCSSRILSIIDYRMLESTGSEGRSEPG